MVISRPCLHPDCPPRNGFIRGQYESVEFIREIPKKPKKLSSSMTDLAKIARSTERSLDDDAIARRAERSEINGIKDEGPSLLPVKEIVRETRKRGKTISYAEPRGHSTKDEGEVNTDLDNDDDETNPVEWIMITRSDPGGNVPRFMVERGTPGGIVTDASKFLDWACKKEHPEDEILALEEGNTELIKHKTRQELEAFETNGHLAGIDGTPEVESPPVAVPRKVGLPIVAPIPEEHHRSSLLSTISDAAYAGIESYAPQGVIDRLPGHQQSQSTSSNLADIPEDTIQNGDASVQRSPSTSPTSSIGSFASAEDYLDNNDGSFSMSVTANSPSRSSTTKNVALLSPQERELAKLNERKRYLNEKFAKSREQGMKTKEELTSKEEERLRKAEEKHAREIQKQEEKYKKEVARLEEKRRKEAAKIEDRKRKAEDKDEKVRLAREKDEAKQQLEIVSKERDLLREQVGALQRENTSLVVRLGKLEEGKDLLREVKSEIESNRSRSSSLRRPKGTPPEKVKEATVLGGEKHEATDAMQ